MENFSPSANNVSDVASKLKNRSAAVRTEEDLRCICCALDPVLSAADVVWGALSLHQKLILCKHFELRSVFDNEGQSLCAERKAEVRVQRDNPYEGGLYILLHGRATISIADGGPSLLVHARGSQIGKVLGRLPMPSEDANVFFKGADVSGRAKSTYHRFVSPKSRQGNDVNILFEKGSTYIVLPESQSRQFLARLNASLIANRIFNDIGMTKLLCKQTHEKSCTHASLINGECKVTKVFRFRAGQILIRQGNATEQVLFIATGSCLILQFNEEQEVRCVGSLLAPCFLGVTALFGGMDSNDQHVSVVAATDGYAFSFCSYCFYAFVERMSSELMDAFANLAQSQMTAWGVKAENDQEKGSLPRKHTVRKRSRPKAVARRKSSLLSEMLFPAKEAAKENSANADAANEETRASNDVFENLLNGKLNRSKLLAAMQETLLTDLCEDGAVNSDVVCDREKWLIDGDKGNILVDVMEALSQGCGIDFTKCEGDDPFHNFVVDKPPAANTEDTRTGCDLQMLLKMPFRMPNRLSNMANECLGRKRPAAYDDSDPFLEPCASVVSRKMHGKTLPVVRQVQCADPLAAKRK